MGAEHARGSPSVDQAGSLRGSSLACPGVAASVVHASKPTDTKDTSDRSIGPVLTRSVSTQPAAPSVQGGYDQLLAWDDRARAQIVEITNLGDDQAWIMPWSDFLCDPPQRLTRLHDDRRRRPDADRTLCTPSGSVGDLPGTDHQGTENQNRREHGDESAAAGQSQRCAGRSRIKDCARSPCGAPRGRRTTDSGRVRGSMPGVEGQGVVPGVVP